MGPRINIVAIAVAFTAGVSISFFTLPLWVTVAINVAKEGSRTDWLGFAGSVIGAVVALVAAVVAWFAVRQQITAQRFAAEEARIEEIKNVRAALRTEIATYAKYVIDALKICQEIATKDQIIPVARASYITKNLVSPVVYPAIADRIALLKHPQATIEFYMRIQEARAITQAMEASVAGLTLAQSAATNLQRSNALSVADLLATALLLVRPIITDDDGLSSELDVRVLDVTLRDIDNALQTAQQIFPNATSFLF